MRLTAGLTTIGSGRWAVLKKALRFVVGYGARVILFMGGTVEPGQVEWLNSHARP